MSIWKRSISLMLAVLMCFSLVSSSFATVFAEEAGDEAETEVIQAATEVASEEDIPSTDATKLGTDEEISEETEPIEEVETSTMETKESVVETEPASNVASEESVAPTEEATTSETAVPEEIDAVITKTEDSDDSEAWRDAGLYALVNGRFVPFNPVTGTVENILSTRAAPSGVYYSDAFGGHSNDLNGNTVMAGGRYNSWVYGDGCWWPASVGIVAQTGYRVCTYNVWCQNGPIYYSTMGGTPLAIPIRISQESGWSEYHYTHNPSDGGGYGIYTQTGSGVPPYKLESLYTSYVPEFTNEEFRDISIIYGVARGMGGMTLDGNADITMAGFTLIMSRIWGYIGVGSDMVFHGSPMGTTSGSVNKYMGEIITRCNVYTKEKGLTGSSYGDNTLSVITSKVGAVADVTGWYVASGSHGANLVSWLLIDRSQSSGNQEFIWCNNSITFDNGVSYSLKKSVTDNAALKDCVANNPLYSLQGAQYGVYTNYQATGTPVETLTTDANGNAVGTKKFAAGTTIYVKELKAPTGYMLDNKVYSFTISASASQNVFKVSDKPSLDPLAINVEKADKDGNFHYLAGAVFKLTYYSEHWANASTPVKRTWYFRTGSGGTFKYSDSYLASGYTSDALFKDDHGTPSLPLGIVEVEEVAAPTGFKVLDKVIYYNITQNANGIAKGQWVTPALKPIGDDPNYSLWYTYSASDDTLNIYNAPYYGKPFEVVKTDYSNNPIQGAIFKVRYYSAGWADENAEVKRTWYFTSDTNGYFTLKSQYLASGYTSDELFDYDKIPLGIMIITEEKAPTGYIADNTAAIWRNKSNDSNTAAISYWTTGDGYTPTTSYGDHVYVPDPTNYPGKLNWGNDERRSLTVKKVTDADSAVLALIADNNAYAVNGAVFRFEATGYETKEVSTNADGEAQRCGNEARRAAESRDFRGIKQCAH